MMLFNGGTIKTISGKETDTFILEMSDDGCNLSNGFCASLLKTYFGKQLSILKINNVVRKYNGYIEISKGKYSTSYIYMFKSLEISQTVADAINSIIIGNKLAN